MSENSFRYTLMPVIPETKAPALAKGFEYDDFSYGGDYRNGDCRQAGHVTHRNANLFVIDVDDLEGFLDTRLGSLLFDLGLEKFITYKSASGPKFHLYFTDPDGSLGDSEWPGQWASKFAYDVKSNGFVRAEPAYVPTGNPPVDVAEILDIWVQFEEAIAADKEAHKAEVRKNRPDKNLDRQSAWSGELSWSDWHHEDSSPVEDFTCDYEDALRIAGQLRNYYEGYEDGLREFTTATYDSPGYEGENWEETFDRLWHSMEPNGGMSIEERQRREEEVWNGIDPDFSGRERAVAEAQVRYENSQAAEQFLRDRFDVPAPALPEPGDDHEPEEWDNAYAPDQYVPGDAPQTIVPAIDPIYQIPGVRNFFERKLAEELYEQRERERAQSEWTARGGFRDDLMDLEDPPKPSMLAITGHSEFPFLIVENSVTVMFGQRGGGKTWTAATWAEQEIRYGNHVVWLDFERQDRLMKKKLDTLRVQKHQARAQFHYSDNGLPPVDYISSCIREWKEASRGKRVLVVIDSFRDLLNAAVPDGDSNSGESVAKVYDVFLNKLHKAGATLCLIDHEAKTGNGSAFGSERKESAADFVLQIEQNIAFTKKRSGYATIHVKKDRYGTVPGNQDATEVGYLWVPGSDDAHKLGYPDRPEIRFDKPDSAEKAEKKQASNDIDVRRIESVVGYLVAHGGLNGLVDAGSYADLAGKLLEEDAKEAPEHRAWVYVQGKQKGQSWKVSSIAARIGDFVNGKYIPESYSYPAKIRKDATGKLFLETAADRVPEVQAEKPSIEGFETDDVPWNN